MYSIASSVLGGMFFLFSFDRDTFLFCYGDFKSRRNWTSKGAYNDDHIVRKLGQKALTGAPKGTSQSVGTQVRHPTRPATPEKRKCKKNTSHRSWWGRQQKELVKSTSKQSAPHRRSPRQQRQKGLEGRRREKNSNNGLVIAQVASQYEEAWQLMENLHEGPPQNTQVQHHTSLVKQPQHKPPPPPEPKSKQTRAHPGHLHPSSRDIPNKTTWLFSAFHDYW